MKSLVVRCCSALSPRNMAEYPKEFPLKYNKLVDVMFKHTQLSSMEGDRCKCQFEDFLESVCQFETGTNLSILINKVSV